MDDDFVLVPRPGNEQTEQAASVAQPEYLNDIEEFIKHLETSLWPLNRFIHDNPELAYKEQKAHGAYTNYMRLQKGWKVTPSAFGMETAWKAVYDTGKAGPVVSFNAEMDALPNLGHACGHNLIGAVSIAASLATASTLSKHNLPGKVVLIGTPAEENGAGGKIKCLKAGAYDEVDVSLISHPGIFNNSPMVRTTAYTHLDIAYHGKPSHAANSPWRGINALDALFVAYGAVSALRQQTRPDDVIGLQITNGGNKPNVIHDYASGVAVLRAVSAPRLEELQRKVEACFRAGAEATGAKMEIKVTKGYEDHVPNRVLSRSFARYWEAMPNPPEPPLPPPGQYTWVKASTDQGNISYKLPSINVSFKIPPGTENGPPHTPDFEKASRTREAFDAAMRVAKAMAGAAVDVCSTPGLLEEIQEQWRKDMEEQRNK